MSDLPQEDELATNVLTGGLSPYMPICLMRDRRRFEKYYTFEGVRGAGINLPRSYACYLRAQCTSSSAQIRIAQRKLLTSSPPDSPS